MEWIETTGKTVAEARELALDQLGVDESEAEFEIVQEPKPGLFGRTRGIARVRARVSPKSPRPKGDRRRRSKKKDGQGEDSGNAASADTTEAPAAARASKTAASPKSQTKAKDQQPKQRRDAAPSKDQKAHAASKNGAQDTDQKAKSQSTRGDESEAETKRKPSSDRRTSREPREPMDEQHQIKVVEGFMSGLLAAFGVEGDLESTFDGKDLRVNVSGADLGALVGRRLNTLESVQELARLALQREADNKEYARVTIDVEDIREQRRESLEKFVRDSVAQVRDEGKTVVFEEMSSADRKQVHDLASQIEGIKSVSEGEDPRRRVALVPAT